MLFSKKTILILIFFFVYFLKTNANQLSGTYTINSGISASTTNFQDFSSAITYMTSSGTRNDGGPLNSSPFGVSGAVTFQVAAGTYAVTSAINIPAVAGVSTTNTITFDGGSGLTCIISGTLDSTSVVLLNQCNYVGFRNITIANLSSGFCGGLAIIGSTSNNSGTGCSVKNCIINLPNTVYPPFLSSCINITSTTNGCGRSATKTDSVEIDSNILNGGGTGIYFYGATSSNFNKGLKARNNVLNNNYQSGIDCYYIYNAIEVLNNVISMSVNAHSNSSGIALTFCFNTSGLSQRVESNKIINAKTYGIILNSPGGNNGSPTKVYNNMICGGFGNYGSNYGIYVNNGGYYTEIYHNSVLMDYPAAIVHALSYSGGTVQIKNNIFVCNTYSGNAYPIYSTSTISGNCINYNIYYNATNTNIIYRNMVSYTSANYLSATAGGDSSFNLLPIFKSKNDLHLANICTTKGLNLTSVVGSDIDGQTRSTSPDIGCDEYLADSNDISALQLIYPVAPISIGAQNLRIKVANSGLNTITSFNVSYKLNNGSAITQAWTGTLNPCDTTSIIFSGTNQVNLINGFNQLKIYTSLPNGQNDINKLNDTVTTQFLPSMSGTYLIGNSPSDFSTIGAAINAIALRGVGGNVIFNIKKGIYNESMDIPNIAGASANRTVTFKSLDNNPDSVIIRETLNNPFVVRLSNASFIKFKLLSIAANSTSVSIVVNFAGNSSYDTIENCKLISPIVNLLNNYVIYGNQNAATNNVIRKNYISGAGSSVAFSAGVPTITAPTDNLVFEYNQVENSPYPIQITNQNGMLFRNNKIYMNIATSGYAYCSIGRIFNSLVTNNVITNDTNIITANVSLLGTVNTGIYHNSIHTVCPNGYLALVDNTSITANVDIRNNVFSHYSYGDTTGNYRIRILNPSVSPSIMKLDYNNYYTNRNILITHGSTNYPNITSWKLASHTDTNSLSYRPGFNSNLDLTPNPFDSASWSLNGRATHLSVVPRDINDSIRPPNKQVGVPDIGAYEFTPLVEPPYAKATPAVPSAGTMQHFTFGEDTVARIKWDAFYPVPSSLNMKNFSGDKPLGTFNGASYMRSYWRIDSVATATYNYDLLLRYKDPWLGTNANETNLLQARNNTASSNTWNVYSTSTIVDTFMNYMSVAGINDFKRFHTGTNTSNTLPVNLFNISASKIKNDAIVNWTTAQEINTNVFEVERLLNSEHAKEWLMLGKLKAAGNSNSIKNYRFTDPDVILSLSKDASFLSTTKTIYYRLKIIDNDGSCTYSKIVSIKLDDELTKNVVQVFPNPFNDFFLVKVILNEDSEIKFRLIDISGKTLFSQNEYVTKGTAILDLKNLPQLQSGFYFLSFVVDWKFHSIKLIRE